MSTEEKTSMVGDVTSNEGVKNQNIQSGSRDQHENAASVLETIYSGTGDSAEALVALEDAGVASMDAGSRLIYSILLRDQGRVADSRHVLENLVDEDSGDARAWYNLALLEYSVGNDEARDVALDAAISADEAMAEAYALRGNLAITDSNWDVAEVNLKKAMELKSNFVEPVVGMAWVMARTDHLDKALTLLNKAVELDPEFVYARVDRSRVNVILKNYNDAEDDLDFAIAREPDVQWHYLDRARIRLKYFQNYDGALNDLNTVERLDQDNFFALVYLAGLHDDLRHFSTADSYYQRVVEARPNYIWAYMPLGKFAWMKGDYARASEWFLKASAEDPKDFTFPLMAGLSMLRSGNRSEADKLLAKTLRMFKPGEATYEVIRFCAERHSDYYAVNALNKEPDETLRERLWFYMGAVYEFEKNDIGTHAVYQRIAKRKNAMEFDLAWSSLNGMDG